MMVKLMFLQMKSGGFDGCSWLNKMDLRISLNLSVAKTSISGGCTLKVSAEITLQPISRLSALQ